MRRVLLAIVVLIVLAILGGYWTLQTHWFREQIRKQTISAIEQATGGRVEIGSFSFDGRSLTATFAPFVLHGTEGPADPPLLQARKVEIGFRLISMASRRIDLRRVLVDAPHLFVRVDAEGRSNIPKPNLPEFKIQRLPQDLLNLQIGELRVDRGEGTYNGSRFVLEANAKAVHASFRYDPRGPRYVGEFSSDLVHILDRQASLSARLGLTASQLQIEEVLIASSGSWLKASGTLENFAAPRASLGLQASVAAGKGAVKFNGTGEVQTSPVFDWVAQGQLNGRGLSYRSSGLNVDVVSLDAQIKAQPHGVTATSFHLAALGGSATGKAELHEWARLSAEGEIKGLPLQSLLQQTLKRTNQWSASLSGPATLDAVIKGTEFHDTVISADLRLTPTAGGIPAEGMAKGSYDARSNKLTFGEAKADIGSTHLELSGTVGDQVDVKMASPNLADVLPAFAILGLEPPRDLPQFSAGGHLQFDGRISGDVYNPRLSGQAQLLNFDEHQEHFDQLSGRFEVDQSHLQASNMTLVQGPFHLEGTGTVGLDHWKVSDASPISANVTLRGAQISKLLEARKIELPWTGMLASTARLQGTIGSPEGTAGIDAENGTAYGEPYQRIRSSVVVTGNMIQMMDVRILTKAGQTQGHATYTRFAKEWREGQISFALSSRSIALGRVERIQQELAGLTGEADLNAQGDVRVTKEEVRVQSIRSEANIRNIAYQGKRYGDLDVTANSKELVVDIRARGNLAGTPIEGFGQWKMVGDDPGRGQIVFPRMTIAVLHGLIPEPQRKELPFEGYIQGKIDIEGPLRKVDEMRAVARIDVAQINSTVGMKPRAGLKVQDLVVRNSRPIVLEATTKSIEIRSAAFQGTDTTVDLGGRIELKPKQQWDMSVRGSINVGILQLFNPNLVGTGMSTVNAAVRGPLEDPQVDGRLELKNASLFVESLPNGLDRANGVILFDRNRATVDSLTATTGGGTITVQKGSFIGFRGDTVLYRVQATADHVRYRSPDGVSLTANGSLSLVGNSDSSVLSGVVTVIRASFTPSTDVGGILAAVTKPMPAPSSPNEYLKGMQLDIRIENAQSLEVESSLTRNIEAEVNLRIRGTPDRPAVLGNLAVTEGQIEFFGNKYRINRGEVNFYNPVKIEPIIDMDLETLVRGITVDITFSGPMSKLNFSYRSDPPLQTNEIIALLAVGRTPIQTGALAAGQVSGATPLSTGTNALLSQAVSAPVEGRLQRFFGVSHFKIDPQLTDLTTLPQSRLSIEQQVSRDITLTYITNLARTQEQIIRVEWDLNRQWSVIALRDENGLFGVDVQYRKRFK